MRDEDIFKRLKKETPLVKRKDLQPLSKKDFPPKGGKFDARIERTGDERRSGYQTRTGAFRRPDSSVTKTDQEDLSIYNDTAHEDTEHVQRPQPRTIQARSETRVRTSPEPLKRPAVRTAAPQPQLRTREDSANAARPDAHPQIQAKVEKKQPQPVQKPVPQAQPIKREENVQAPQARPASSPPRETLDARQPRKTAARDAYVPADAAELDIFNDSPSRKTGHVRADSSALAPMRVDRTEFEEYYEPAQAPDSVPAFRHELKYYINYAEYILLRNTLKALAQLDRYAGENGEYAIRSLYFDDEYESALVEKLGGSDYRKKYRIRIYNYRDDVIKFEKKIKQGQFITKRSLNLSRDEYDRIMAGEYAFLLRRKEPLASELYLELTGNRLRPRVLVDYIREAYVYPFENIRITFDKELRSGMWLSPDIFNPDLPTLPMYDEGLMVLEVKFEKSLPAHIQGVLNNVRTAQRCAISKYLICRKFE